MATSHFKYGPWIPKTAAWTDCPKNIRIRLERYLDTGNTEWLVDVANFAMMEYMVPKHPKAHFRETGSHEAPKVKDNE